MRESHNNAPRALTRRQALGGVGAIVAGSVAGSARAQSPATPAPTARPAAPAAVRLAPRAELVNVLEFEEQAKVKLAPAAYSQIAGGDRAAFDRITLRPRMMMPVLDMDLSLTLFGEKHFSPILVGPMGDQTRFHAEGELATVKGAAAAKTAIVVSSGSGVPLAQLVAAAKTPLWYQVFASDPSAPTQMQQAVSAGCKVMCITIGASPAAATARTAATVTAIDWAIVASLKRRATVPVIVKGIATPAAARLALEAGADGIIVSNYGGLVGAKDSPVLGIAGIVDAVGGKVPVLADGSFRRGTDILKALAFGAQAVVVGRPVIWGLAAYGADGVQSVLEMLQTELARYMGMCGKETLKALDRTVVKVHSQA
jgi:4-hydroxymandelate oxidase